MRRKTYPRLRQVEPDLIHSGYSHLRVIDDRVCGLHAYLMTVGLMVGIDAIGYERRYCYEHTEEAQHALLAWDGRGHQGVSWIKCKGACGDLLNPLLTA